MKGLWRQYGGLRTGDRRRRHNGRWTIGDGGRDSIPAAGRQAGLILTAAVGVQRGRQCRCQAATSRVDEGRGSLKTRLT
jgi:hypothetical protein